MISIAIKRLLKKWKFSQERLGEITQSNRGVIQSYIKEDPSKPSVDFMLNLETILGGKISIRELWNNDFEEEDIPLQPILDGSFLRENKAKADLNIEEAFKKILQEVGELRKEIKTLKKK